MGFNARKPVFDVCKQQRHRPACKSVWSDQCFCYALIGEYHILTCYKQIFKLVSVAQETGLSLALSETQKTGFVVLIPKYSKTCRAFSSNFGKRPLDKIGKLEDLKVLRRSPDLLNNVKIGQGQLQLIMEQILFYHICCRHFGQVT